MSQLAQLHLRGSLCTKTMKNLTQEQKVEIEKIIDIVMRDPNLQSCKHEFCAALGRTIRNEYANKEVAMQDYRIAILRAAVAAKHGWGTHEPIEEALTDPVQRKKWFQTWAFKYLKQMLRENKIPSYKYSKKRLLPADKAAIQEIKNIIKSAIATLQDPQEKQLLKQAFSKLQVESSDSRYQLFIDQWTFPAELVFELGKLTEQYLSYDVEIIQEQDRIVVNPLDSVLPGVEVQDSRELLIKFLHFESKQDNEDGDGFRYQLEYEVSEIKGMSKNSYQESDSMDHDIIAVLRSRLPDEAVSVLDVIVDTPLDYIEKFGNGPIRKTHLARYLDKTPRDIGRTLQIIKVHAMALGVGLD